MNQNVLPENFYQTVEQTARDLYIESQKDVPPDVRAALARAIETESSAKARGMMQVMLQAVELGDTRKMLVCQDTGLPIYWVTIGAGMRVDGVRLLEAIERGTARATIEHPFRSSIVSPLGRENRQTSTGKGIPHVHVGFTDQHDELEILMVPKGSGSESNTYLKMLTPAEGVQGIKKFVLDCVYEAAGKTCPPSIIGVGVGGSADQCVALAKQAITRPLGSHNSDATIAALEDELLAVINQTGIGPMGLGGDTTALAVHIEDAWTHITLNPVAVNFQCWRGLRRRAMIRHDGTVRIGY